MSEPVILVAEDERDIRDLIVFTLQMHGFKVLQEKPRSHNRRLLPVFSQQAQEAVGLAPGSADTALTVAPGIFHLLDRLSPRSREDAVCLGHSLFH